MKRLLAVAFFALAACGGDVASDTGYAISSSDEVQEARVVAVMSHADWCPSCKIVEPLVQTVRAAHDLDGVAFTQIDYTARDQASFFIQGQNLGVGDAVRARFGEEIFTGRMILVDADTQTIVGEINKTMDEDQVLAEFRNALARS